MNSLLLASVVALLAAPAIHRLMSTAQRTRAAMDGFVLGTLTLLVGGHIMPEAAHLAGGWALLAGLFGVLAPLVVEGIGRRRGLGERVIISVLLLGLLAHAFLDGVALQEGVGPASLGPAVVVHKLPVGLMLWMLVRPRGGALLAWALLALIAATTVLGGLWGPPPLSATAQGLLASFVGGALLHVVGGGHGSASERRLPRWELLGAAMGGGAVWILYGSHLAGPSWGRFLSLMLETAPALGLGFVLAGLVVAFLPQLPSNWLSGGSSFGQAGRGVLFGLPIPICSCGVVPVYEGLVRRGIPATAAMAFLIATPELGLDSLLLSLPLLGPELTGARVAAALVLALGVGVLVGERTEVAARQPSEEPSDAATGPDLRARLTLAARYGLVDVVDDTAPWILVGLVAAAWIDPSSMGSALVGLPPGVDVLAAAVAGIPLYICASGATPLAAALLLLGISPGAAVALLLAGPATNVTTFGVLRRCHGTPTAALFGATVFVLAVGSGLLINALLGTDLDVAISPHLEPQAYGLASWAALAVVGLLFAASLWRLGPRAFLEQVVLVGHHHHDHDHGEHHPGHDHSCSVHHHSHDHSHSVHHHEHDHDPQGHDPRPRHGHGH